MIDWRGVFCTLVSIAMLPAISGLGSAARAQDPFAADPPDPPVQQGAWTDEQFDNWIDQIVSGINDQDSPDRGRLRERLTLKVEWIELSCNISEAQKKKLEIAGRGDIKRFMDEMRGMKRRYRQIKGDPVEFAKLQQRISEIQTSSASDLFGDSSFLSKMVQKTLSEEQAAALARAVEESRAFSHRAAVLQAVQFCDAAVGLKDEQRRRLTELFVLETRQMKRDLSSELPLQFLMVLKTAKLSRAKLRAILDERQWFVMSALLKQLEQGVNAVGFGAIMGGMPGMGGGMPGMGGGMGMMCVPVSGPADGARSDALNVEDEHAAETRKRNDK
jgi:hypothetical protein